MPRDIVKAESYCVRLDDIPAPGRKVFSPTFDFKALAFRALPQFRDGEPLPAYNSDGTIGNWLSSGYIGAIFNTLERKTTVILKHAEDSDAVLADSPIYRMFQYFRPYIKCRQSNKPHELSYWKQIDKKLWEVFGKYFPSGAEVAPFGFVQAVVFVAGSKKLQPPAGLTGDEKAPLIMLKRSALERMVNAVSGENELNDRNADPIDLARGPFIQVTRLGAEKSFFPTTGTESGGGYDVNILNRYADIPQDLSRYKDLFLKTVTPWDSTFTLLNADEQLELLRLSDIPMFFVYESLKDLGFNLPDTIIRRAHEERKRFGLAPTTVRSVPIERSHEPYEKEERSYDNDFESAVVGKSQKASADILDDDEEESPIIDVDELFNS